jgi:Domain of unknown function (DUF4349)/Putative zinc-finger
MNRTMHEIEPEELMAYLDGELEASRASEVTAHMSACSECASLAVDLQRVSKSLNEFCIESAPNVVVESIERAIAATGKPAPAETQLRQRPPRWRRWLSQHPSAWKFLTASAAVVVALAFFLQRSGIMLSRRQAPIDMQARNFTELSTPQAASDSNGLFHGLGDHAPNSFSLDGDSITDQKSRVDSDEALSTAGPMIARTAAIMLVVTKLDDSHAALEKLLAQHHGFASDMTVDKSNASSPSLSATLRVPASELVPVLAELRRLGRVTTESQGGEDVSDQHVDLTARLHNARETEQRLLEILRTRTGTVGDVLAVEMQISQTRGQIEQMEAQLENLDKRVSYASIKLQMGEEYKEPAGASNGVGLRLRNSIVGGYRDAVESLIVLVAFFFSAGPTLLLWCALLFWPARAIWRRRGALRSAFSREAAR